MSDPNEGNPWWAYGYPSDELFGAPGASALTAAYAPGLPWNADGQRSSYAPESEPEPAPAETRSLGPEDAYNAWVATPAAFRAAPDWKVVVGHAGKTYAKHLNTGCLRGFEVAHGIPRDTLEYTRNNAHPSGVKVGGGVEA